MLDHLACPVLLLFLTWFAHYIFKRPKKDKISSTTYSTERTETVVTNKKLVMISNSRESYIPEYVPVYTVPEKVSSKTAEFKAPAPRCNKSRQSESRRQRTKNVRRASLDTDSSSSDSEDYSDEDLTTYPRFKVERRPLVKPSSLSVTQTPSHFRPALGESTMMKKTKHRSSTDREKKRKRRFACESTASVKGATITVKRRKWNIEKTGKTQKKRSLSAEHRVSRRLKVKKIDASALYDPIYDVDCGLKLSLSLLADASPPVNVRERLITK